MKEKSEQAVKLKLGLHFDAGDNYT